MIRFLDSFGTIEVFCNFIIFIGRCFVGRRSLTGRGSLLGIGCFVITIIIVGLCPIKLCFAIKEITIIYIYSCKNTSNPP